jgi:hypothetical protein
MAYVTNIGIGAPPLLWSSVQQAFDEINQNFLELGVALSNSLDLDPLDFTNLNSSIAPNNSNEFGLGTDVKTWKNLYLTEWFNIPGSELNGLWLGSAHVKGIGSVVELPANSTVGGELIINPDNTSFKTFAVSGQSNVVADTFTDTLNLASTTGITITTNASTDTITFANSGVRSVTGTTHLGVSSATGEVTLTNLGVTDLTAGPGISIDNSIGSVEITNTGIRGITSGGGGITVFIDGNNIASISNTAPVTRSFATIRVPDSDDLNADITSDILKIVPGYGVNITTSEVPGSSTSESEQLNISFNNNVDIIGSVFADNSSIMVDAIGQKFYGDLNGSVFGDDSSILIDGTGGRIVGPVYTSTLRTSESKIALGVGTGQTSQGNDAVAIGYYAGQTSQGGSSVSVGPAAGQTSQGNFSVAIGSVAGGTNQGSIAVAIGQNAGETNQGSSGVAIGYYAGKDSQDTGAVAIGYVAAQVTQGTAGVAIGWGAGQSNQGDYAIAIGYRAGFVNQHAASTVLNASGSLLNTTGAGFYVNPIRSTANGTPLMYDTATSEIFYSSVLEFIGSKISTSDSSGIVIDVPATFNTQVNVEGTLTVGDGITGYLSLAELKSVVAESSSFADFQSKIAAL